MSATIVAPPDARAARHATLAIGALVAQQIAGKAARDALFLTSFDIRQLPLASATGSLLSAAAIVLFARALARFTPHRVVPAAIAANAALLVLEWGLSLSYRPAAALVFYLHIALFGVTLASGFWSLVNERFDPHLAKRLVGRIGTGASAGGVLGGVLAFLASALVPVPATLLLMALLSVVALFALRGVGSAPDGLSGGEVPGDPLAGLRTLTGSDHLRTLAGFVALSAAVEVLLELGLNVQAVGAGLTGASLLAFFAGFQTLAGLVGLALQALAARRTLNSLGLAGTAALRPGAVVAGGLAGALLPGLPTALLARGLDVALHHSLFRSAYELFYTPLPEAKKRSVKALVDVGCDKLGSAGGSALAVALLALGPLAPRALLATAAGGALGALLLCRRLHTGYVQSLADGLRSGAVQLDAEDIGDSTTLHTLSLTALGLRPAGARPEPVPTAAGDDPVLSAVESLRSPDPERVRQALAAPLVSALAGHVIALLVRNDVLLEVLRSLRRAAPSITGQLLDAMLDPTQPLRLRRRVPRVLRDCPTQRAVEGLLLGLADPEFELRYECAAALARLTERTPALRVAPEPLLAAARRALEPWPTAPDDVARRLDHVYHLLAPTHDRQPLRLALSAVRGEGRLRGTALEYLDNVLPAELAGPLLRVLGGSRGSSAGRTRAAMVAELQQEAAFAAIAGRDDDRD